MCINVIVQQKGVKFLLTAESVQRPFFLLITRRECSLVCKGPLNSRLCPDSLAEHLVCKHVPPKQRVPFAGTSLLPYCGCINFLQNPRVDLFQNFPQFIVIHTVKVFGIFNKGVLKKGFFLELSCFFHDPADVGNLISGFSRRKLMRPQ